LTVVAAITSLRKDCLCGANTANFSERQSQPRARLKNSKVYKGDRMISGLIWWIVVGLIAGWAAGKIMKGGGYGAVMDIVLGIVGAVLGGWIFNALGIYPGGGIIGSIVVAIIGAIFLIWLTRLIKKA
jgi:uncharacterized membrane protein YeaQ/YmgE (transglycosylase-associated protein family)